MTIEIKYYICPGGRKQGHYTDFFSIVAKNEETREEFLVSGTTKPIVRIDEGLKALRDALNEAAEKTGYPIKPSTKGRPHLADDAREIFELKQG